MTGYEEALADIERAYEDGDYTLYEERIERASKQFGKPEQQVEYDAALLALGIDGN